MRAKRIWYGFLCAVVRCAMFFWHPVFRVAGREHVPAGPCVVCSNHAGLADPIWIIFALREGRFFRILAKDQLMHIPLLGRFLRWIGVIGVKRGEGDLAAMKAALRALRDGEKLLIFPEGTRVRGDRLEGKTGAVLLAHRSGCPILPLYIQRRRRPFAPLRVVFGAPYQIEAAGPRLTAEELRRMTDEMLDGIYEMGASVG